jgi:glycosyltransferase involved in cell wall biosynthesis
MTEPRVAVIIPCYNDGALAEEALASVREDEPVEVVIVDDGSTEDDTLRRLDALEQQGVNVVRSASGGPGAARTAGLRAAAAPLIYPLDADDLLEAGALAHMANALERHPRAGFAWGDYTIFGDYEGKYRSPDRWLPWTLTYVNPYPICSMFQRWALERAGGWKQRTYEDWDLWLRLIGLGIDGIRVDRIVYHRRLTGGGRQVRQDRLRHREAYARLQRANADVFARREELRVRERPAAWKRLVYPVLFGSRRFVPIAVESFLQRRMMRLGTGLPG